MKDNNTQNHTKCKTTTAIELRLQKLLLNKPYKNEVTLTGQNPYLKLGTITQNVQPRPLAYKRLLNKPYKNEVTLPRMLCNKNEAISHLQAEMGFVEDFR